MYRLSNKLQFLLFYSFKTLAVHNFLKKSLIKIRINRDNNIANCNKNNSNKNIFSFYIRQVNKNENIMLKPVENLNTVLA